MDTSAQCAIQVAQSVWLHLVVTGLYSNKWHTGQRSSSLTISSLGLASMSPFFGDSIDRSRFSRMCRESALVVSRDPDVFKLSRRGDIDLESR